MGVGVNPLVCHTCEDRRTGALLAYPIEVIMDLGFTQRPERQCTATSESAFGRRRTHGAEQCEMWRDAEPRGEPRESGGLHQGETRDVTVV